LQNQIKKNSYFDEILTPENFRKYELCFTAFKENMQAFGKGGFKAVYKEDSDGKGQIKRRNFLITTPPIKVTQAFLHGVGTIFDPESGDPTKKKGNDKRVFKLTAEAKATAQDEAETGIVGLVEQQKTFKDLMKKLKLDLVGKLINEPNFTTWKSTTKSVDESIEQRSNESPEEYQKRIFELKKSICSNALNCYERKEPLKVGGKIHQPDDPVGSVFRAKATVFFPKKPADVAQAEATNPEKTKKKIGTEILKSSRNKTR